jgi:hypothetical protein
MPRGGVQLDRTGLPQNARHFTWHAKKNLKKNQIVLAISHGEKKISEMMGHVLVVYRLPGFYFFLIIGPQLFCCKII